MFPKVALIYACLCTVPVCSFSFSVDPSPVGVNQGYQISWEYEQGEAPDNSFAIEVQGEDSYLQWFGFFNSSGSTSAPGPPSAGVYTLAAYTNVPGENAGTFFTSTFTVQDQPGPTTSTSIIQDSAPPTSSSISTSAVTQTSSKTSSASASTHSTASSDTSSEQSSSSSSVPLSSPSSSSSTISSFKSSSTVSSVVSSSSDSGSSWSSKTTLPTSSTSTPATTESASPPSTISSSSDKKTIIIATCLGGAAFLALSLLVAFCLRRRRMARRKTPYFPSQPIRLSLRYRIRAQSLRKSYSSGETAGSA